MGNEKAPERIGNVSEVDRVAARRLIHTLGSITGFENRVDLVLAALATVRAEVWNETFRIQCVDCAEDDEPIYSKEARWFYHGISNQEVGCSASKLRIAALESAENRKGEG